MLKSTLCDVRSYVSIVLEKVFYLENSTVKVTLALDRARMLLWKSEAKTDRAIADGLGVDVNTVIECRYRSTNRWHNPVDIGKSLSSYFKGNTSVSCNIARRPFLFVFTPTHLVAEHE